MQHDEKRWQNLGFQLGAVVLALLLTSLVILAAGAPPLDAFKQLLKGAFGAKMNVADTIVAWVPAAGNQRFAGHVCRWFVEYRCRGTNHPGFDLYHWDIAVITGQ